MIYYCAHYANSYNVVSAIGVAAMRNYTRTQKICETCGGDFSVPHYRKDKARFCSAACRSSWVAQNHLNKGPKPWAALNLDGHRHKSKSRFKQGQAPWNKGMSGIQLSPDTQFKPGRDSERRAPVGEVRERKTKGGVIRAFVKVAEPNVWQARAKLVWERHNGPLPRGMVIHHKDRNPLNDAPENLQAMTRAEHIEEHRNEF